MTGAKTISDQIRHLTFQQMLFQRVVVVVVFHIVNICVCKTLDKMVRRSIHFTLMDKTIANVDKQDVYFCTSSYIYAF